MGPDYLRGVLAACRVTGMLARLDLGEQYNNASLVLGTARELQDWERNGASAVRRGGGHSNRVAKGDRWDGVNNRCITTAVVRSDSALVTKQRRQCDVASW